MEDQNTQITCGIIKNSLNKQTISQLVKTNRKIIEFPELKTKRVSIDKNSQNPLKKIQEYDWLILTDVFAAEYFLEMLYEIRIDPFILDNLRVCSFGEAVSDQLRFVQIHSDIIPSNLEAEKIFDEIFNYIGDHDEFKETKFIVVKGEYKKEKITDLLEKEGAVTEEFGVYNLFVEKNKELPKIKTLLIGGAIDEFLFNSPKDLIYLKYYFSENLNELLSPVETLAKDEITYKYLLENGLNPKMFGQKLKKG